MSNYLLRDIKFAWRWVKSLRPGGETPGLAAIAWLVDRFHRARRGRS